MKKPPFFASAWHYPSALGALSGARRIHSPPQLEGARMLVLWGGEDISPAIYGQKAVKAHSGDIPSRRDMCEVTLAHAAVKMGIPILGICRGAQLLCALGGGSLYQHVDNHAGPNHDMIVGHEVIETNSVHHQMMITTEEMEVIGYTPARSPLKWLDQSDPITNKDAEPEVVYIPKMKALCVQGHPEWLGNRHHLVKLVKLLCGEKFNVEI